MGAHARNVAFIRNAPKNIEQHSKNKKNRGDMGFSSLLHATAIRDVEMGGGSKGQKKIGGKKEVSGIIANQISS